MFTAVPAEQVLHAGEHWWREHWWGVRVHQAQTVHGDGRLLYRHAEKVLYLPGLLYCAFMALNIIDNCCLSNSLYHAIVYLDTDLFIVWISSYNWIETILFYKVRHLSVLFMIVGWGTMWLSGNVLDCKPLVPGPWQGQLLVAPHCSEALPISFVLNGAAPGMLHINLSNHTVCQWC